jgi:hypothetical protein
MNAKRLESLLDGMLRLHDELKAAGETKTADRVWALYLHACSLVEDKAA